MVVKPSLKILADENIPFVEKAFSTYGRVETCPGREITAERVREADVLLVRSVTPVDEALLVGSPVQFVGSATIGIDHVDVRYLQKEGITFAHAPGSNAESVVEYVMAALLRLAVRKGRRLEELTAGVVGCGNVGGRLAARLEALGLGVLRNDPPLAESAGAEGFVPLKKLLEEADVISLHVPLTTTGPYPTYHLVDEAVLEQLRPEAWLINTSRGSVVDNRALRRHLERGRLAAVVLDVWEGEPCPDPALIRRTDLATPHIAGYSFDGKVQGTVMLYEALTRHLGTAPAWDAEKVLAPSDEDTLSLTLPDKTLAMEAWFDLLVEQMYPIEADDKLLRALLEQPADEQGAYFSGLRKNYRRRRTFRRFVVEAVSVPEAYRTAVAQGLGVRLV